MREVLEHDESSEPEGTGWVTSPQLENTEILQIILCRFTGDKPYRMACDARDQGLHPDEDCLMLYVSAKGLEVPINPDMLASVVRSAPLGILEPLHVDPVGNHGSSND